MARTFAAGRRHPSVPSSLPAAALAAWQRVRIGLRASALSVPLPAEPSRDECRVDSNVDSNEVEPFPTRRRTALAATRKRHPSSIVIAVWRLNRPRLPKSFAIRPPDLTLPHRLHLIEVVSRQGFPAIFGARTESGTKIADDRNAADWPAKIVWLTPMRLETPRLLITDDDRDFRVTVADVLRSRGFDTLEAGDGEEALDVLHHEQVHLLLLDMHMPRLSGLETIRRLRQVELEVAVPWILISAALDDQIVAEARAAAVFSVLPKPLRLPQLTSAVAGALRQTYNWPE